MWCWHDDLIWSIRLVWWLLIWYFGELSSLVFIWFTNLVIWLITFTFQNDSQMFKRHFCCRQLLRSTCCLFSVQCWNAVWWNVPFWPCSNFGYYYNPSLKVGFKSHSNYPDIYSIHISIFTVRQGNGT